MDSNGLYKAMGSTSSRVPAGFCFRSQLRFDPQTIPVCPTVSMSHCFSRQFLLLNDVYYEISLFNLKKMCPYIPHLKRAGFTGSWINYGHSSILRWARVRCPGFFYKLAQIKPCTIQIISISEVERSSPDSTTCANLSSQVSSPILKHITGINVK